MNNEDYRNFNNNNFIIDIEQQPDIEIQLSDQGTPGPPGNGISYIELISVEGEEFTYRINFTNGEIYDYIVYNGTNTLKWLPIKREDWISEGNIYKYTYSGAYVILDVFEGTFSEGHKVNAEISIINGVYNIYSLNKFNGYILCSSAEEPIPAQEYVYEQSEPSVEWIINHNLNTHPTVIIVDNSGDVVDCDINYTNSNTVVLNFTTPFSGIAYLNYTR